MLPRRAFIGLGGNVGDVAMAFAAATTVLANSAGVRLLGSSRYYRAPAWGPIAQPDFLNAVLAVETTLNSADLLALLLAIEVAAGRDRGSEIRLGPRTLDLDLLVVGSEVLHAPQLQLPHPRIGERAFVLVPWAEIAPETLIPGLGRVATLRDALDCSGVEAIP